MKSIETIQAELRLNKMQIMGAYDNAIRYYLSDEDLEPFLIKAKEKSIAWKMALRRLGR